MADQQWANWEESTSQTVRYASLVWRALAGGKIESLEVRGQSSPESKRASNTNKFELAPRMKAELSVRSPF
jgi:hypothetical protein